MGDVSILIIQIHRLLLQLGSYHSRCINRELQMHSGQMDQLLQHQTPKPFADNKSSVFFAAGARLCELKIANIV